MNREYRIDQVICTQVGSLPAGGVIFSLADSGSRYLWAGTSAGLFFRDELAWRPVLRGFPLRQVPVIAVSQRTVLAAGADATMLRSADQGKTWQRCLLPPQVASITTLAMSPAFTQDGVALAGTDQHGILRSVDGGRSWKPANFGLRNFQVNAIAAAPSWQRKEPVFAAMEQGIYYSPNAGRAWQAAGLPGVAALCIAISPNYWSDGLVVAGAADGKIHASRNQGRTWVIYETGGELDDPVNCLRFLPNGALVAGMGSGRILISSEEGNSWELIAVLPGAVLALIEFRGMILAGVGAEGLYSSPDLETWHREGALAARQIHVLAYKSGQHIAVGGVGEGIWLSQDGGMAWSEAYSPEGERINALALAWEAQNLLAACGPAVMRLSPQHTIYEDAFRDGEVLSLATCQYGVWAGAADGSLWYKPSHERDWEQAPSPCRGAVISIYCSGEAALGSSMLVVSRADIDKRLEFWRSDDQGSHWDLMRVEITSLLAVRCAYLDHRWHIALGSSIVFNGLDGWQRVRISGDDAPVLALLALPGAGLIAATVDRLLFSSDAINWTRLPCEMAEDGIVDLKLISIDDHQAQIAGITSNGKIFRLEIAGG
jgi:photosystem II stability/assembly factor-like uncharacterized protein